jgi:hypothetical protein
LGKALLVSADADLSSVPSSKAPPIDELGQLAPVFSQPADGPDAVELDRVVSRGQPGLPNVVEAFYYSDGYEPEGTIAVSMGTGRFPGGKGKPIEIRPWLH